MSRFPWILALVAALPVVGQEALAQDQTLERQEIEGALFAEAGQRRRRRPPRRSREAPPARRSPAPEGEASGEPDAGAEAEEENEFAGYEEMAAGPEEEQEQEQEQESGSALSGEDGPPEGEAGEETPEEIAGSPGSALRRSNRLDFDERLVKGQGARSGAVYLFKRTPRQLPELVKLRTTYRHRIIEPVLGRHVAKAPAPVRQKAPPPPPVKTESSETASSEAEETTSKAVRRRRRRRKNTRLRRRRRRPEGQQKQP